MVFVPKILETDEQGLVPTERSPKPLVRMAVREEFVPREKSATVLIFSAYV